MADPYDIGPVLEWLRRWKRIFDSRAELERLIHRPRTDQLLGDLRRRLARATNRFRELDGRDAALAEAIRREADFLEPLLRFARAELHEDDLYREYLTATGVDVALLEDVLTRPPDTSDAFERLEHQLDDKRLQPADVEAIAGVAFRADQEDLRLLVELALREHRADDLAKLPQRAVAFASWPRAFRSLGPDEVRRTPGPDLIFELVASMITDAPARPGLDDGPWNLEREVRRFAESQDLDPMSHVASALVHGRVLVDSPDDLAGARAVVHCFVRSCLVEVLFRRGLQMEETAPTTAEALWAALQQHGWTSEVAASLAEWGTPRSMATATARQAAANFAADKVARLASEHMDDGRARHVAEAVAGGRPVDFASKAMHERIRPACRAALEAACHSLRALEPGQLSGAEDIERFGAHWATALAYWSSRSSAFDWEVPRGPRIATADELMQAIRDAVVGIEEPRTVAWLVHGFTPSPEPVELAGITLTDPRTHDFGPGRYALALSRGESVLLARVGVEARTPEHARVLGRARLERALDAMAFAACGEEARDGLDPTIRLGMSTVEEPASGNWHGRSDEDGRQPKGRTAAEAARLALAYERLLTKTDALTPLEKRVVNALPWYRRARWEHDPTRRMLSYWILIEGAFSRRGNNKGAHCIARAAQLHATWSSLEQLQGLEATLYHFERTLSRQDGLLAKAESLLPNWRRPRTQLLKPDCMSRLAEDLDADAALRQSAVKMDDQAAFWRDRGDTVRAMLRRRRWEIEILLDQAYRHRNGIVHQSKLVGVDDVMLSIQLEQIARDLLTKMVEGTQPPEPCKTLGDLIAWWEEPF